MPPSTPHDAAATAAPSVPLSRYAAGVVITVVAVLSQYFVPQLLPPARVLYDNLPGDLFVIYGLPVIAFALLVGAAPLRHWRDRMGRATWEGLRWYGLLSLLAILVIYVLEFVYLAIDPSALHLLSRPNPALEQAQANPWFYVGFAFVVGAFEETIFRGWIFGYWNNRPGNWLLPASWTSAVFAGVHLYYATTYGVAAPLIFPSLFLTGFAFAATYRYSGGNLVVPALLHGANDASSYLTIVPEAWGTAVGLAFHYGLILVGGLIGLIEYLRPGPDVPPSAMPPDGGPP